jgi:hypothetical protein
MRTGLVRPPLLRVFPSGWRALIERFAGSPVGYDLTGSVVGGFEPRVRGRSTAVGPGGGAAPWGYRWHHRLCGQPSSRRPLPAQSLREHSDPSPAPTCKREVLLPRPRSSPLTRPTTAAHRDDHEHEGRQFPAPLLTHLIAHSAPQTWGRRPRRAGRPMPYLLPYPWSELERWDD